MGSPLEVFQTINPNTGEVVKVYPTSTDAEISKALSIADHRYQSDWCHRSVKERAAIVARAASILRSKAEEYAQLITLEMGKLIDQARGEVQLSADILQYYADNGEEFLKPKPVPGHDAIVKSEPIGVIFAIEPWNYPYYQLAREAAPQIVAGNVVIFKHAPSVPQCALAFARLFEEAGAPVGVYTNLFCSIDQAASIIDDFLVRGVTLTGSERAGSSVAERAGKNLKKVVLELGGSDPVIVLEDAPLDDAVRNALIGRLVCMGQACGATKRIIIIGKERGQKFMDLFVDGLKALKVGDPSDESTSIGPLVSSQALNRILDQINEAKKHGAKIVYGSNRIADRKGWYLEPTVITNISEENPLFQVETFGPVASFYIVDSEEEAIRIANATKFGLAASVFTDDLERADKIADRIDSGTVFINSFGYTAPGLPWGGVKNSGFGRLLGEIGITEFLNQKVVITKKNL